MTRGPWHAWFAWRPVWTRYHGWQWGCMLRRRRWWAPLGVPGAHEGWEYDYEPEEQP